MQKICIKERNGKHEFKKVRKVPLGTSGYQCGHCGSWWMSSVFIAVREALLDPKVYLVVEDAGLGVARLTYKSRA